MAIDARTEQLPDLADEVLFPRLSEAKLARLAEKGRRRTFAPGELLYEQGDRDTPFFVVERGRVALVDVLLPPDQPLPAAHRRAGEIEAAVRERCPELSDVIVHTEPATP